MTELKYCNKIYAKLIQVMQDLIVKSLIFHALRRTVNNLVLILADQTG